MCSGTGVGSEKFFGTEFMILLVNNAPHAADAVCSDHSQASWVPLVCEQAVSKREVALGKVSCDAWNLRMLRHWLKTILSEPACLKKCSFVYFC